MVIQNFFRVVYIRKTRDLGPVVQSIVSIKSSLRGQLAKCFTTLKPITLIFFAEKVRSQFFNKKCWHLSDI